MYSTRRNSEYSRYVNNINKDYYTPSSYAYYPPSYQYINLTSPRRYSNGDYGTYGRSYRTAYNTDNYSDNDQKSKEPTYSRRERHKYSGIWTEQSTKERPSTERRKSSNTKYRERDSRKHSKTVDDDISKYDLKSWTPNRFPIKLVGSIFDPESFGQWVLDWSKFVFNTNTPIFDIVIDFTSNLQLFNKNTEQLINYRNETTKLLQDEILMEFLAAGKRIANTLSALIDSYEGVMIKYNKDRKIKLKRDSAQRFIRELFNDLEDSNKRDKLITSIRLWNFRFDANCKDLLASY